MIDAARRASLYLSIAGLAAALGLLLATGSVGIALAGTLGIGVLLVQAVELLGFRAITAWVVLGVVFFPFLRYPHQHAVLTFDRAWLLSLAVALLLSGSHRAMRARASSQFAIWAGIFVAAVVLRGLRTAADPRGAFELALDTVVLPGVLFIATRRMMGTADNWDRLARAFAAAGAILGLIACAERLFGFQLATLSGGVVTNETGVGVRVSGPYATDDALAVALLMCLAGTLLWIQTSPRARWGVGSIVVALELAGITFTFFRGAWIASLVVIVVAIGLRPRRYARLLGTLALVGAIAAVLLLQAQDIRGLSQRLNNTQNVSGRVATYSQALQLFARHPLDGVGLGQFATAQKNELMNTSVAGVQAVSFAHNSYLDALSEGGLLVFLPFLGATLACGNLIYRFRKVARTERHDVLIGATVAAAALAYLLISLEETVITSSTASNAFFALLLGGCAARMDAVAGGPSHNHA